MRHGPDLGHRRLVFSKVVHRLTGLLARAERQTEAINGIPVESAGPKMLTAMHRSSVRRVRRLDISSPIRSIKDHAFLFIAKKLSVP